MTRFYIENLNTKFTMQDNIYFLIGLFYYKNCTVIWKIAPLWNIKIYFSCYHMRDLLFCISNLLMTLFHPNFLILNKFCYLKLIVIKAVVQRCSVRKVLSETSQNSQENTCARASFLIKLQASRALFY